MSFSWRLEHEAPRLVRSLSPDESFLVDAIEYAIDRGKIVRMGSQLETDGVSSAREHIPADSVRPRGVAGCPGADIGRDPTASI